MSVIANDAVAGIAADLAGAPVRRMRQLGGGRNSRVFRVETDGATYALKLYPPPTEDRRDRLGVETSALRWMQAHGLAMVPRVMASDRTRDAALLSWADGDLVRDGVGAAEVAQACDFLRQLHALRDTPALPPSDLAAEACLSGAEIERQLRGRIAELRMLDDPMLAAFLTDHAEPALAARLAAARDGIAASGGVFAADLPQAQRSQVPADFGFHNALRRADGYLTFIDFEYFGWDDPAKLIGDLLLHPGTPVEEAARAALHAGALRIYGDAPGFAARLQALLPLLGLRWALILLNEFRPERWRRRVLAGATEPWESAKRRQLAAALQMLDRHAAISAGCGMSPPATIG
jgi:Ser/Thr protein kinase RdoA (MazF antagonist)